MEAKDIQIRRMALIATVKELWKSTNLPHEEIGEILGKDKSVIYKRLSGKNITVDSLLEILDTLGLTLKVVENGNSED